MKVALILGHSRYIVISTLPRWYEACFINRELKKGQPTEWYSKDGLSLIKSYRAFDRIYVGGVENWGVIFGFVS